MKKLLLLASIFFTGLTITAQTFYTKNGTLNFNATSAASPEKIDASHRQAVCVIDTKTGAMQLSVLMKGFQFKRALMEEHFNENYVESDKFPKAEFKGTIVNNNSVSYLKDGVYGIQVKGKLTLHGETKDVETDGKLTIEGSKITAAANFSIPLADYKISIPGVVADKVAKIATINVLCTLEPFKK